MALKNVRFFLWQYLQRLTEKVKLITGLVILGGFTHTDIDTPVQMFQTPRFGHTSSIDYAELNPKSVVRVGTSSPDQYEDSCNVRHQATEV